MKSLITLLLTLSLPAISALPQDDVLEKFQQAWNDTKTFRAAFAQLVESKMGIDESGGILYVSKPDKLRWESAKDGNIEILNGKQLTSIHVNKQGTRVVNIVKNINQAVDTRALSFLAGKAKFNELYKVQTLENSAKTAKLKLVPKGKAGGETYIAEINKNGYFLLSLKTEAPESKVTMKFSDVKANIPLKEELFEFKPDPKDIIRNQ